MELSQNTDTLDGSLRFSAHTRAIASEGAAGWVIADAAADALDRGEDVVSLCLGDTSFDTPIRITDAAIRSLRAGRTHYAPVPGTPELRRNVARAQNRFDRQDWSADQVTVFAGAQNALFAAVMTVAGAGDEVLYLEPWYATYEATIRAGGAVARPVKLSMDAGGARLSKESILAQVTERTRAILLNSPNNPGGYVLDRAELETVASVAERHNLWIISDEVYRNAVFDGAFLSAASLPGDPGAHDHREQPVEIPCDDRLARGVDAGPTLGRRPSPEHGPMHAVRLADLRPGCGGGRAGRGGR